MQHLYEDNAQSYRGLAPNHEFPPATTARSRAWQTSQSVRKWSSPPWKRGSMVATWVGCFAFNIAKGAARLFRWLYNGGYITKGHLVEFFSSPRCPQISVYPKEGKMAYRNDQDRPCKNNAKMRYMFCFSCFFLSYASSFKNEPLLNEEGSVV